MINPADITQRKTNYDLRFLLALLLVYRSNFHLMHWLVKGANFNTLHEQCKGYYDMLLDDADEVAEMLLRGHQQPVNYQEANDLLDKCQDRNFKMLESTRDFNSEECNIITKELLSDIKFVIEEVLHTMNADDDITRVGIKSQLEAMHNKYDLELNYKTYRRTM